MHIKIVTWVICYIIPCHTWNPYFFEFVMAPLNLYMCCDDNTRTQTKMNVAHIMIRTKYIMIFE